ncbi:hypothetical protein K461DRAFT_292891 [Myriangium duriaei CBS 260.36]|uniref:Bromo domain-containing protein n=1 Tax=Myriangium duriaei CBS 260.36 TaxID=1168546 RepID=A0A9P4MII3_9PEZI|nr:hypothetical protein K461DRAFT_292891 [Myriangium duriaei CBS 260.36]
MVTNGISSPRYTPLESLLFFQALRAQDLTSIDFDVISNELVTLPLVKDDASFDRDRLSAGALRSLYLNLVKEEALEETKEQSGMPNGELSPGSRKRKAASPSLPTVEAAAKHAHLLPKLLYKLYSRYRETVVNAIKEEEQTIDRLNQEIKQIEAGEFDDKLRLQNGDNLHVPQVEEKIARPELVHIQTADLTQPDKITQVADAPPANEPETTNATKPDQRSRSARTSIGALVSHTPEPEAAKSALAPTQTSSTAGPAPTAPDMAQEQLSKAPPPIQARPHGQSPLLQQGPPPPIYQPSPPMKQTSPYMSQLPFQNLPPGPALSPPTQHTAQNRSPNSPPRVLPMPSAAKTQSSPVMQNGFQQARGQLPMQPPPYGSPNQRPSPTPGHPAGRGYPTPQHQPYQNFQPQFQQYPQSPYMHQHSPSQPQQYQIRPSQQGGFQLPPFQVSAQDPSKVHHQYPNQQASQHNRHSTPMAQHGAGGQSPYAQYTPAPHTPQPTQRSALDTDRLTKSVVASLRRRRSTSTWKASPHPPLVPPKSPPRPVAEPMSPVRAHAELPKNEKREDPAKTPAEQLVREDEAIKQLKSESKRSTRKARGSSVASSTKTGSVRGRSQSVLSQPEGPSTSDPTPSSRRKVKAEPSTPAAAPSEAGTPQARTTRTRRGTLQPPPSSVPSTTRRSPRAVTPAPTRSDTVPATRNFSRLSNVILNEITAHRHAGPFQKPVSDRDVEGYGDIIKRPQDLKSIKAAITAGSKAVNAVLATLEEDDGGAALVLPKTEELIPPRGIVNSAQLEKEVMRMFANAVLFNPGDEGIVRDAREMADDITGKIQDWRGVEREGAERERDKEREEEDGGAKRRKI